jgi:hypothetical protein
MKTLLAVALFFALSFNMAAQTQVSAQGGAISDLNSKALSLPLSPAIAVYTGGSLILTSGTVLISTPVFSSGTLAAGATFGAGGAFIVQIPSQSIAYNATIAAGAQWTKITLANGTHQYTLTGSATDIVTGETSNFVLLTNNVGLGNFAVTAGVYSINISLN